ncbi:MAG: phosphate signaling complex protein PhoU [Promethearchaeota archaeon]
MAEKFHEKLAELKYDVMRMGLFAGDMLSKAIEALKKRDTKLAEFVLSQKILLSEMDDEIEAKALQLLTLYQPMAKDVRVVACSLKLITYLTRIGRYGKDIANITVILAKEPLNEVIKPVKIPQMGELTEEMIDDSLNAFYTEDLSLIGPEDLSERDDDLDSLRYSIFRECVSYMIEDPHKINVCTHYIMVGRYLERCGDHACKMAEKIHYMVTGKRVDIS